METPKSSKRLSTGTRVYYFDRYEDGKGQPYLSISEIPTDLMPGKKKRQRIFVHAENIEGFIKALTEVAEDMGKSNVNKS